MGENDYSGEISTAIEGIVSLSLTGKIVQQIAKTKFARNALEENSAANPFKEKPSPKVLIGIIFVAFSYIVGWPMIGLCGALAVYWKEPLVAIVGVPIFFVVAHLFFLAGVYLAGGKYLLPVLRWLTRIILKKLI